MLLFFTLITGTENIVYLLTLNYLCVILIFLVYDYQANNH